jgi:hypothetical protein
LLRSSRSRSSSLSLSRGGRRRSLGISLRLGLHRRFSIGLRLRGRLGSGLVRSRLLACSSRGRVARRSAGVNRARIAGSCSSGIAGSSLSPSVASNRGIARRRAVRLRLLRCIRGRACAAQRTIVHLLRRLLLLLRLLLRLQVLLDNAHGFVASSGSSGGGVGISRGESSGLLIGSGSGRSSSLRSGIRGRSGIIAESGRVARGSARGGSACRRQVGTGGSSRSQVGSCTTPTE